jgi:glycosyltransferase involved in cell wall biosynthesis
MHTDNYPLLSIVIPAYNAEAFLAETIRSALGQSWPNKEVIIIDDGSTDGTISVAQKYESEIVKVISANHGGAAAARNRGLRVAKGDFIQYVDADDLLAPDKCESQIRTLKFDGEEVIGVCAWRRFYCVRDDGDFVEYKWWRDCSAIEWLVGGYIAPPVAWMVPRRIADAAGEWNEALCIHEDPEYFTRLLVHSNGIRFSKNTCCYYRKRPNSLGQLRSREAYESMLTSIELNMRRLLRLRNDAITQSACASRIAEFKYFLYPEMPDLLSKADALLEQLTCRKGSLLTYPGGRVFKSVAPLIGLDSALQLRHWLKSKQNIMLNKTSGR